MTKPAKKDPTPKNPETRVELLTSISKADLNDLCDSTALAIENGGGFGWLEVPERDVMERYWEGVIAMPLRQLFVAKLDDVICGTTQIILSPPNNQAQAHSVTMTSAFLAPWARGFGLAKKLIDTVERRMKQDGYSVINLDVRETQTNAINLFENAGYTQCGIHPHYAHVDGKDIRGYYYYKKL